MVRGGQRLGCRVVLRARLRPVLSATHNSLCLAVPLTPKAGVAVSGSPLNCVIWYILIARTTLQGRCYCLHFADKETLAQTE